MGKSRLGAIVMEIEEYKPSRIAFANTMSSKEKKDFKLDEFSQQEMLDDPAEQVQTFGRVNRKRIAEAQAAKTRKQLL